MTCPACQAAHDAPRMNEFTSGCLSCKARAIASTGGHLASEAAGRITPEYREALTKLFGEGWKEGNEAVKQWSKRLKACRAL